MPSVQRRAERGLNAIGRPRQVEESAPVRLDFDGNWGFSESARSKSCCKINYPLPKPTWPCPFCGYIHSPADLLRIDSERLRCKR